MARFVNIGFGNIVNADKIVAVVAPDAAPIKRLVQAAKEGGRIIDASQGRRTKAVIMTEESFVILSALQPDTIGRRFHSDKYVNVIEERNILEEKNATEEKSAAEKKGESNE